MSEEEFTRLFLLYRVSIYRICLCSLKDPSEAEDVTQEVFLKLYTKAPVLSSDEQVKAWLIRVAVNACRDVFRSARYRLTEPIDENIGGTPADNTEENRLLTIITQLKPKIRTVMYMYYYEEYSVREISELLGISETAVSSRLQRGREQLKALIEKEGL